MASGAAGRREWKTPGGSLARNSLLEAQSNMTQSDRLITLYHGTSSKRGSRICGNGVSAKQGFKGAHCVYLAEDIPTARFFAVEKASDAVAKQIEMGNGDMAPSNICVIEFSIPSDLAAELQIEERSRSPLGVHSGMAFADISDGSGYERVLDGEERIAAFNAALIDGRIKHRRLRFDKVSRA
jgi:hypothetical protein